MRDLGFEYARRISNKYNLNKGTTFYQLNQMHGQRVKKEQFEVNDFYVKNRSVNHEEAKAKINEQIGRTYWQSVAGQFIDNYKRSE